MLSIKARKGIATAAAFSTLVGGVLVSTTAGAGADSAVSAGCRVVEGSVAAQACYEFETTTSLSAAPTSAQLGSTVEFSSEIGVLYHRDAVTVAEPLPDPTGTVVYKAGDTKVASGSVADLKAGAATSELPVGVHEITAVYGGDEYYKSSTSTPVTVTITAPPTTTTTTTVPVTPASPSGTYTTANGAPSTALTVTTSGTIPVRGDGWEPGTEVEVWLHSDPVLLGAVNAGADGAFSTSYAVPAGAPLGAHQVVMTGTGANGQPATVTLDLTIVAAAVATPKAAAPSKLAFTG